MQRLIRQLARATASLLLALFAATLVATQASAHAELKSSDPADGATLASQPSSVTLNFSEETSPTASTLEVYYSADGKTNLLQVDNADGKVNLDDRTKISVTLKSGVGDGVYTVKWKSVTEDDGGIAQGSFSFTVTSGGPSSGPTPSGGNTFTLPTTGQSGANLLLMLIVAAIIIVGFYVRRLTASRTAYNTNTSKENEYR